MIPARLSPSTIRAKPPPEVEADPSPLHTRPDPDVYGADLIFCLFNDDSKFLECWARSTAKAVEGDMRVEGKKITSPGDGPHGQGFYAIYQDFIFDFDCAFQDRFEVCQVRNNSSLTPYPLLAASRFLWMVFSSFPAK